MRPVPLAFVFGLWGKTMRHLLLILLVLFLGACNSGDSDSTLSAEDVAKSQQLLHDYNTARDSRNWEAAQQIGDNLRSKYGDSDAAKSMNKSYDDTAKMADAKREEDRLAALWNYASIPAGSGKQYSAMIDSHVELDQNGLPLNKPDARLVLRIHPDWGHSSYLLLENKAFVCGQPCTMKISFDGGDAMVFKGTQADSGQGPALFIDDYKAFYAAMLPAKKVKIVLQKNGDYAPTFVFDVDGYDSTRLGAEF
jgi:hypothetical protein